MEDIVTLLNLDLYPKLLQMYTDIFCLCESYARVTSEMCKDISYQQMWKVILAVDAEAKRDAMDISDAIVKEANERGIYGHGAEDDRK